MRRPRVEPGSRRILFLPYLMGERSPWWNPNARGVFFGRALGHKRASDKSCSRECDFQFESYSRGKLRRNNTNLYSYARYEQFYKYFRKLYMSMVPLYDGLTSLEV